MDILKELADYAARRVEEDRKRVPEEELRELCGSPERLSARGGGGRFYEALKKPGMSFICEVKKASPSKGIISEEFPYMDIARAYRDAGADCISCLTEPKWFLGSDDIFREIRGEVETPMIRKDFTVSEYQIYQARVMGANAVLLICAILDTKTIERCLGICDDLGLDALVEAHDSREIASAVSAGARIIGVNNRNLRDFSVDFSNAARLRDAIPPEAVYVAESGVSCPEDVAVMKSIGADAVLMGEVLMRAADKGKMLREMRRAAQ